MEQNNQIFSYMLKIVLFHFIAYFSKNIEYHGAIYNTDYPLNFLTSSLPNLSL